MSFKLQVNKDNKDYMNKYLRNPNGQAGRLLLFEYVTVKEAVIYSCNKTYNNKYAYLDLFF